MKQESSLSKCWEIVTDSNGNKIGYVSTFIHINRQSKEISQLSFHYHPDMFCNAKDVKIFYTWEALQDHLLYLSETTNKA